MQCFWQRHFNRTKILFEKSFFYKIFCCVFRPAFLVHFLLKLDWNDFFAFSGLFSSAFRCRLAFGSQLPIAKNPAYSPVFLSFLNFHPENKNIAATTTEKKYFNQFLVCKHLKGGPNTQLCFLEISVFFLVWKLTGARV